MVNCPSPISRGAYNPGSAGTPYLPNIKLLLVSRDPDWAVAIRGATTQIGGGLVTSDARGALAELAGSASHYTHLLVDCNGSEGFLDELADVAKEIVAPDTNVLVLGAAAARHPYIRV